MKVPATLNCSQIVNVVAAMEQQFQDELDEAPYIAKMRAVMGGSSRFPTGPSQVNVNY